MPLARGARRLGNAFCMSVPPLVPAGGHPLPGGEPTTLLRGVRPGRLAMQTHPSSCLTVLVIFGAAGDLARRKLVPALYNLFLDGRLPGPFAVLGVDRVALDDDGFRRQLRAGVDRFARRGKARVDVWGTFASHISYLQAGLLDP